MDDAKLNLSVFLSATDNGPIFAEMRWDELVEFLREESAKPKHRGDKRYHLAMTMCRFSGTRANENATEFTGIACDIDHPPSDPRYRSFDGWRDHLTALGVAFVLYTTTSSRMTHHKVRIVLRYAHAIERDRHLAAWQAVNAKLGGALDGATKDEARISFLPAVWHGEIPDGHTDFATGEGGAILSASELAVLSIKKTMIAATKNRTAPNGAAARGTPRLAMADTLRSTLSDIHRSPLVSPAMRRRAASQEARGGRVYGFMLWVARRAIKMSRPIDADILAALATAFEHTDITDRAPVDDPKLWRQAENAIAQAIHESASGGSRQLNS